MNVMTQLFNLGRPITELDGTKYTYIANKYKMSNYRIISDGEVIVRGKNIEIPTYVKNFINEHREVLMIASMYNNTVYGITIRSLKEKAFLNYGYGKGKFYGLGDLDPNFKFGDLLILVEGAIDRDVCKLFISRNCLSVLTAGVTTKQAEVISHLTNRVLLLLDNDEAGKRGENSTKRKLTSLGVSVRTFNKSDYIKDLGDLLELKMKNDPRFDMILLSYRAIVSSEGGNLNGFNANTNL